MGSLSFTSRPHIALSKLQHSQIYPFSSKAPFFLHTSQKACSFCSKNGLTLRFAISCKLKTSNDGAQSKEKNKKSVATSKIVVPESNGAPSLSEEENTVKSNGAPVNPQKPPLPRDNSTQFGFLKSFSRRVLAILSNLPLALAEMFAVAALMALGTHYFSSPLCKYIFLCSFA